MGVYRRNRLTDQYVLSRIFKHEGQQRSKENVKTNHNHTGANYHLQYSHQHSNFLRGNMGHKRIGISSKGKVTSVTKVPEITPELEIERSLVVSTCHMSEKDNGMLELESSENIAPVLLVYRYEFGFLIFTGKPIEELIDKDVTDNYSPALQNLLKLAVYNKCTYLKLDCGALEYEGLEKFNW